MLLPFSAKSLQAGSYTAKRVVQVPWIWHAQLFGQAFISDRLTSLRLADQQWQRRAGVLLIRFVTLHVRCFFCRFRPCHRPLLKSVVQATACSPFLATRLSNLSEDPPGHLSRRSHRLTSPDVILRALRAEDIHHRRTADPVLVFRRLLLLDYVPQFRPQYTRTYWKHFRFSDDVKSVVDHPSSPNTSTPRATFPASISSNACGSCSNG